MIEKLLIATNNKGKIEEISALLKDLEAEIITPQALNMQIKPAETGLTYAENARIKARAFCRAAGIPVLADDTGLEVPALGGAPGLHSKRFSPDPEATDADRRKLLDLLALKRRVQGKGHTCLLEVLYDLLAITGYAARCERVGDVDAMLNLAVLSRLVAAFDEHAGTRTLYPFLDYLKLMREGGVDPAVVEPEDAVWVMTIHQAKGLEVPVVVVASVMNGRLPSTRRREHYEVPYDLRASGEPEVSDPHLVDERKLFYVAATRARRRLVFASLEKAVARRGPEDSSHAALLAQREGGADELRNRRAAQLAVGQGAAQCAQEQAQRALAL